MNATRFQAPRHAAVSMRDAAMRGAATRGYGRRHRLGAFPQISESLRTAGPILAITVGIPESVAQALRAQGKTPPPPEELNALIDSGASITGIQTDVAARLGLPVTGNVMLAGVGGTSQQALYGARFAFPDNDLVFDAISLVGSPQRFPGFDILIGRNLMCSMVFTYDGPRGKFSLTNGLA